MCLTLIWKVNVSTVTFKKENNTQHVFYDDVRIWLHACVCLYTTQSLVETRMHTSSQRSWNATPKDVHSKYVINFQPWLLSRLTHKHTDTDTDTHTHTHTQGWDSLHTWKDIHNESLLKPHTLNSGDYPYWDTLRGYSLARFTAALRVLPTCEGTFHSHSLTVRTHNVTGVLLCFQLQQ